MSRRARAIGFGAAALVCAALAASIASSYSGRVARQYGPLRTAVVAAADLRAHAVVRPEGASRLLAVRRMPAGLIPPGVLSHPEGAIGLAPMAPIPAGSYVVAAQLRPPGRRPRAAPGPRVGRGHQPVEIAVAGAAALGVSGRDPVGMKVDVVVTTEPRAGTGRGRTYVAAEAVRLLALGESGDAADPLGAPGRWSATLALTRPEALRLIQAETYARAVRLIASG